MKKGGWWQTGFAADGFEYRDDAESYRDRHMPDGVVLHSPDDDKWWIFAGVVEPGTECPECHNQFGGRMPGHVYGSNWDFVPCQTCKGTGLAPDATERPEEP